jgi:hypothetical protein
MVRFFYATNPLKMLLNPKEIEIISVKRVLFLNLVIANLAIEVNASV